MQRQWRAAPRVPPAHECTWLPRIVLKSVGSVDQDQQNESALEARLLLILERLVGIGRDLGNRSRILADLFLQVLQGSVKLRVAALEGGVRKIVNNHIRIYPVPFDQPLAIGSVDTYFSCGGDSAVGEGVACGEPDLASPGAD